MAVRSGKQTTAGRQTIPAHPGSAAPAHVDAAAEAERLREFLRPTVEEHNLILEAVEVRLAGSHRTLHVVVDLPGEGIEGVSLDAVAGVSQSVSDALDNDPGDDGRPYDLEVSSPGVSRPLTQPRHWRRNIGRLVDVKLVDGEVLEGRLTDAGEASVSLTPLIAVRKGTKPKFGDSRDIPYDSIRKGTVQVEFARDDAEESGGDND